MTIKDGIIISFLTLNGILDIWKRRVSYSLLILYGAGAIVYDIWEMKLVPWQTFVGLLPGLFVLLCGNLSRGAIGYGDGFVVVILGLYMNLWEGMEVLFLAFFGSSIWAIVLLLFRKGKKDTAFPFVPFLLFGYLGRMVLLL